MVQRKAASRSRSQENSACRFVMQASARKSMTWLSLILSSTLIVCLINTKSVPFASADGVMCNSKDHSNPPADAGGTDSMSSVPNHQDSANFDRQMMQRAVELAARGVGQVSPGPLVGTVIVDPNQQIAGEGFYLFDQVKHAETV